MTFELDEKLRYGHFRMGVRAAKENFDDCKKLMTHMLIVRAEMRDWGYCIEYDAISDFFDTIDPGQIIPHYKFHIKGDSVTAEKCEPCESQVTITKEDNHDHR